MAELKNALSSAIKQCYRGSEDNFSYIYPFTTENISGYIDLFDLEGKSLLTVGSSCDQALNAILKGCKDVTVLDVNKYVQYYYYLKVAGIMCLSYDAFLAFFRYNNYYDGNGYNNYSFDKVIFDKIKKTLKDIDSDSYEFWNTLFEMFDGIDIRTGLFSDDEFPDYRLKKMNSYLSSEASFHNTLYKLQSVKPNFVTSCVEDVSILKKFDSIWLSNVSQYLSIEQVKNVVSNLANNLYDDGKMMFGYLFAYNKLKCFSNNNDLYDIKFIENLFPKGVVDVEQFEAATRGNEDAILTYKKKKIKS